MNEAPSADVRAHPQRLDNLIDACKALKPVETGVVYPLSGDALMGAVEAGRDGLINPVLIGPADAIRALAKKEGADLGAWKIVDVPDPEDAATKACSMAGRGEVQALMKGSLHTDELLHAVVQKEAGLRTGRLLSHCALIFSPAYGRRIVLSDAARQARVGRRGQAGDRGLLPEALPSTSAPLRRA